MLVRKIYVFSVLLLLSVAGISQEALAKTITLTEAGRDKWCAFVR